MFKRISKILIAFAFVVLVFPINVEAKTVDYNVATLDFDEVEVVNGIITMYEDDEVTIEIEILDYKPLNSADTPTAKLPDWVYDIGTGSWSGIPPAGTYEIVARKETLFYEASFHANCTMSSGADNAINYIYSPALEGPLYSITYTQFEILQKKPTANSYASAILAWSADINPAGIQIYRLNGYLKLEMNNGQFRVKWKI